MVIFGMVSFMLVCFLCQGVSETLLVSSYDEEEDYV